MLPARLAQLHPANEGLFIGLRLSAANQGLASAVAGPSLTDPPPPPTRRSPLPPAAQPSLHMPVLVWLRRTEGDYLSLLHLIAS